MISESCDTALNIFLKTNDGKEMENGLNYELLCQGLTTYDYIVALREQEQQELGGGQSPQMSQVSSLTGLSSASSFNNFRRGAWCTPPRLFLEDQVRFYDSFLPIILLGLFILLHVPVSNP